MITRTLSSLICLGTLLALVFCGVVLLVGCNTAPVIVPDITSESPITMKLKHEIMNGTQITDNWGWILWYLPVLLLVVGWSWKEFLGRRRDR